MIKVAMIRLMAARLAGEDVEPHGPVETEAARRLADDPKHAQSWSVGYQHPLSGGGGSPAAGPARWASPMSVGGRFAGR